MSIAIMQPYIFPYIGYFQLINSADTFIFYDDVNFINKGWINRNKIISNGSDMLFTIPCKKASQNKLIKDIEVAAEFKIYENLLKTIQISYRKAPFYKEIFPIIENTITYKDGLTIADMAINSVLNVCNYLNIKKSFKKSSVNYKNQELKKGDRLIDICHIENESTYINPSGGKEIYTKEYFNEKNVNLLFLNSDLKIYKQFDNSFVPWLSIVDVLMFNDKHKIVTELLQSYHLD